MQIDYSLSPVKREEQFTRHWFRKYRKAERAVWVLAVTQACTIGVLIAMLAAR